MSLSDTINFQPMPKRFMIWHRTRQAFLEWGGEMVLDLYTLSGLLDCYSSVEFYEDLDIVQSTNLHGEDGEEIFEGSIIKGKNYTYEVVFAYGGFYAIHDSAKVGYIETSLYKLLYHEGGAEVIGHILSSPELLEEDNE